LSFLTPFFFIDKKQNKEQNFLFSEKREGLGVSFWAEDKLQS
jgi:hypothetical protein